MPELFDETTRDFATAAAELGRIRGGRPLSVATVFRWATEGRVAGDGRRVYLEAKRIGSRWITSREALDRFFDALTPKPAEAHSDA